MDQRHQEYVEYYHARLERAERCPLFPRTAAAERALFQAISTAPSLEDFRRLEQEGKLSLACAVGRAMDVAAAEAAFYTEIEETVRARPHQEVLQRLEQTPPQTVEDLTSVVTEINTRWQLEISRDEMLRDEFWGDWKILEDIECDELAEVPAAWREERREAVARELARGEKSWREQTLPAFRKFVPDFTPDWDALWQLRHRRLFPLADSVVAARIEDHKRYLGVR